MDRHTKGWKRGTLALAAGAALTGTVLWGMQDELGVTWYELTLPAGLEALDGLTIVHLSDLHSADLEAELGSALEGVDPDLIVLTGDLVSRGDRDLKTALKTAALAAQRAPSYFVPGNHEADSLCYPELREGLERSGVTVLEDQAAQLWWNGGEINLIGARDLKFDPEGRRAARAALPGKVRALCREGALNILLSHRPDMMEEYAASGADVVFSGHAHGGQIILPLVGPLISTHNGLFPKNTSGVYRAGAAQVVISRGLGNGTPVPRLWNPPELVAVRLRAGK